MHRILLTGIATLDIINVVDHYPHEDEELRALAHDEQSGGNAANTAVVLNQLGHHVEFAGVISEASGGKKIINDLKRNNISINYCQYDSGAPPVSYITINRENGSRTIVHYRTIPELSFESFDKIPLSEFDWYHFEGRNVESTLKMLDKIQQEIIEKPVSLEVEKPRTSIEQLYPYADVVFFSRNFAVTCGFAAAEEFLQAQRKEIPHAILICAWGELGAWALDHNNTLHHSRAYPPEYIIDTLGAGDTFNAAMIHNLLNNTGLTSSLSSACKLAGRKIAQQGFDQLVSNDTFETQPR